MYTTVIKHEGDLIMPIPVKTPLEKQKTAKERIYTQLREWIINGTLEPGEKISDQEISQYFSVSRTPAREAIQMLSDQKLVEIYPGKSTCVSPIDLKEASSHYRMIAELHALAVEFAWPHLTPEYIRILEECDQLFTAAVHAKNIAEARRFDSQFHQHFLTLADNHFLTEFTEILSSHIQRIENIYFQHLDITTFESHEKILDALRSCDLDSAKNAVRENWLHTLQEIQLP